MMNQEIMCEVEVGTHGAMVEIGDDDQVGVKVPALTNHILSCLRQDNPSSSLSSTF